MLVQSWLWLAKSLHIILDVLPPTKHWKLSVADVTLIVTTVNTKGILAKIYRDLQNVSPTVFVLKT